LAEYEAALFPIPNLVAFPGTIIPLHVFEPRYRQLVKDCIEDGRLIGVCHTKKTIRDAPQNQTAEEMLRSNQATYQPQEVFSAGECKLIETTPDGRLLAEIHVEHRLAIQSEKQTLPYRIVVCEELDDEPDQTEQDNRELQQKIAQLLHPMIAQQDQKIADALMNPAWEPDAFSFGIFQYLRLDPDVMQDILETRSAHARLSMIWQIVRQGASD
jgi:Lon protease-like protein